MNSGDVTEQRLDAVELLRHPQAGDFNSPAGRSAAADQHADRLGGSRNSEGESRKAKVMHSAFRLPTSPCGERDLPTSLFLNEPALPIRALRYQFSSAVNMIIQVNRLQGGPPRSKRRLRRCRRRWPPRAKRNAINSSPVWRMPASTIRMPLRCF